MDLVNVYKCNRNKVTADSRKPRRICAERRLANIANYSRKRWTILNAYLSKTQIQI